MSIEIPIYLDFNDLYLYENDKYFYSIETGEIFIHGYPLSKLINRYSFNDIIFSIYFNKLGYYRKIPIYNRIMRIMRILYGEMDKYDDLSKKLMVINLYNGYTPIHNSYVILRSHRLGLIEIINLIKRLGCKWYYRRYIEFIRWLSNREYYIKSNYSWKTLPHGKLPSWQNYVRNLISAYIKERYRDLYNEFKEIDKYYREYIKKYGYSPLELYQYYIYYNKLINNLEKIILYPKILMGELIFNDYMQTGGREIYLKPLYKGVLRQGSTPKLF